MPVVRLADLPAAPGREVALHVRERGSGPAVVLLHGGWGYGAYPFDRQVAALEPRFRVVAPDRLGYGRSDRLDELADGFHRLMAEETFRTLDALGIGEAALWGHSDGAVIAAWCAILFPDRVRALVLEALHAVAAKRASVDFFRTGAEAPERFGEAVVRALEADHGERWRAVVGMGARAWLRIIERGVAGEGDLYQDRLGEVRAPTLLLHGRADPRTEPGEIEGAARRIAGSRLRWLDAGHSPHTGARAAGECTEAARAFLESAGRPRR